MLAHLEMSFSKYSLSIERYSYHLHLQIGVSKLIAHIKCVVYAIYPSAKSLDPLEIKSAQ